MQAIARRIRPRSWAVDGSSELKESTAEFIKEGGKPVKLKENRNLLTRVGPEMSSTKKHYSTPQLIVHGDVKRITQQGGYSSTDVPWGTPVGPGGITSVAT